MALLQELENIVGTAGICRWEDTQEFLQKIIAGAIAPGTKIDCIVYPNTQAELAAAIACVSRNHCGVLPMGGGSKLDWGGLVKTEPPIPPYPPLVRGGIEISNISEPPFLRGKIEISNISEPQSTREINLSEPPFLRGAGGIVAVSCDRINRLIDRAIGDLTVTIEAGMKFTKLQEILANANQFLPLDPTYSETATIGGIIATADAGSWRQKYRGVRDLLLGITFVRADGKIAQAGGRVVKNVAGYDLMKLLTGSYGTLGVISQVTMRVYPLPEASSTVILTGETTNLAKATQTLLSSSLTPTALDLLSTRLVEKLGFGKSLGLIVRFQSVAESVKEQSTRLLELGNHLGLKGITCTENDEFNLWQRLKETISQPVSDSTILCKIGVTPSAAANILTDLNLGDSLIHGGSGLGIFRIDMATAEIILQLRRQCELKGGFLTILKAPPDLKQQIDVWGYQGNALNLMQKIKQQFDPQNILNPHRFLSGI
ncbi:glycolate oxidase [Oscillatoriales cyanobacterium USR001]|nr:glycolate oxidase [Oscillatoriales cyanobacterium USR001]